jgi:hypothetical protein
VNSFHALRASKALKSAAFTAYRRAAIAGEASAGDGAAGIKQFFDVRRLV